jgi:hypothetical protein
VGWGEVVLASYRTLEGKFGLRQLIITGNN